MPGPTLDDYLQGAIPPEAWDLIAADYRELIRAREAERRRAPGGVKLPHVPDRLRWWAWFADDAARQFVACKQAAERKAKLAARQEVADLRDEVAGLRGELAAACASPSPDGGTVVALPQNPPFSEEQWVGTKEAKRITGLSQERMRQLAASGEARSRKRLGRWEIETGTLRAWDERRRGIHGTSGGEDDGHGTGSEPQRADSRGTESRSQAA